MLTKNENVAGSREHAENRGHRGKNIFFEQEKKNMDKAITKLRAKCSAWFRNKVKKFIVEYDLDPTSDLITRVMTNMMTSELMNKSKKEITQLSKSNQSIGNVLKTHLDQVLTKESLDRFHEKAVEFLDERTVTVTKLLRAHGIPQSNERAIDYLLSRPSETSDTDRLSAKVLSTMKKEGIIKSYTKAFSPETFAQAENLVGLYYDGISDKKRNEVATLIAQHYDPNCAFARLSPKMIGIIDAQVKNLPARRASKRRATKPKKGSNKKTQRASSSKRTPSAAPNVPQAHQPTIPLAQQKPAPVVVPVAVPVASSAHSVNNKPPKPASVVPVVPVVPVQKARTPPQIPVPSAPVEKARTPPQRHASKEVAHHMRIEDDDSDDDNTQEEGGVDESVSQTPFKSWNWKINTKKPSPKTAPVVPAPKEEVRQRVQTKKQKKKQNRQKFGPLDFIDSDSDEEEIKDIVPVPVSQRASSRVSPPVQAQPKSAPVVHAPGEEVRNSKGPHSLRGHQEAIEESSSDGDSDGESVNSEPKGTPPSTPKRGNYSKGGGYASGSPTVLPHLAQQASHTAPSASRVKPTRSRVQTGSLRSGSTSSSYGNAFDDKDPDMNVRGIPKSNSSSVGVRKPSKKQYSDSDGSGSDSDSDEGGDPQKRGSKNKIPAASLPSSRSRSRAASRRMGSPTPTLPISTSSRSRSGVLPPPSRSQSGATPPSRSLSGVTARQHDNVPPPKSTTSPARGGVQYEKVSSTPPDTYIKPFHMLTEYEIEGLNLIRTDISLEERIKQKKDFLNKPTPVYIKDSQLQNSIIAIRNLERDIAGYIQLHKELWDDNAPSTNYIYNMTINYPEPYKSRFLEWKENCKQYVMVASREYSLYRELNDENDISEKDFLKEQLTFLKSNKPNKEYDSTYKLILDNPLMKQDFIHYMEKRVKK